jgi:RNA recognition motif-containing protein
VKTIFVGNLTSNLTPDELRILLQSYGAVKEVEIVKRCHSLLIFSFAGVSAAGAGRRNPEAVAEGPHTW